MALKILNNCRPLSSYSQSLSSRRGLQEKSILDCLFQSPVDHQIIAIFPWSSLFLSMPEYESLHDLWHHCHEEIDAVQSSLCFDVFLHCRHESQRGRFCDHLKILSNTSLPCHLIETVFGEWQNHSTARTWLFLSWYHFNITQKFLSRYHFNITRMFLSQYHFNITRMFLPRQPESYCWLEDLADSRRLALTCCKPRQEALCMTGPICK